MIFFDLKSPLNLIFDHETSLITFGAQKFPKKILEEVKVQNAAPYKVKLNPFNAFRL
jgi:hypothetical protein